MTTVENVIPKIEITDSKEREAIDYTHLISKFTQNYTLDERFIYYGVPSKSQGWILHLTIIPTQLEKLLDSLIPLLLDFKLPFKLVKSKKLHIKTNCGDFGYHQIGKILTVYLDKEEIIGPFMDKLTPLTEPHNGPRVFTDFHLTNILFTRYGRFTPTVFMDGMGDLIPIIKDGNGNEFIDKYYTPPVIPANINYPFKQYQNNIESTKIHVIKGKYLPIRMLKSDVKGDVWKALRFSTYRFLTWCVIKQGRLGMFSDDFGRDMTDRLQWQREVNKVIKDKRFPKILDFFSERGQAILITEYVNKSRSLQAQIAKLFEGSVWFNQPTKIKIQAIDYAIQIVEIVNFLHQLEYIHRDITGNNFLITRNKLVKAIDLELSYSLSDKQPNPPFKLGTDGYMSPEQDAGQSPTKTDDVYSIGSILILIITGGIEPIYLLDKRDKVLKEKLTFFACNAPLVNLIMNCHSKTPKARPGLQEIKQELTNIKSLISNDHKSNKINNYLSFKSYRETIQSGIQGLCTHLMIENNRWFAEVNDEYGNDVYPLGNKHFYSNLYKGYSGIIWLLWKLKRKGYDISFVEDRITTYINELKTHLSETIDLIHPSLLYGSSGYAVMLSEGIKAGAIENSTENIDLILKSFTIEPNSLDLIYGIAGQGVAALHCQNVINDQFLNQVISNCIEKLVKKQNKDGSWFPENNHSKERITGFGYGIAGIVYFLMECAQRFKNATAFNHAEKGLQYLMKSAMKKKDYYAWKDSDIVNQTSSWWCQGGPGIALTFLKAFEITKVGKYKQFAEKALRIYPNDFTHHKLSICHGICGLGEIYLDAFNATGNVEWKERSNWLANVVMNLRKETVEGETYWLVDRSDFPTAGLMLGNAGVLHFLSRLEDNDATNFPLLP